MGQPFVFLLQMPGCHAHVARERRQQLATKGLRRQ
jgi:hypothetical protein